MNSFPRIWAAVTVALLLLSVSGCATLSRSECESANWYTIGYEDGLAGYAATRIGEHRKACAEYGIAPNLDSYLKGRTAGLKSYCRPAHGYHLGLSGASFRDVCPSESSPLFSKAYQEGRAVYVAREAVERLERRLREKQAERRDLEKTVKRYEAELIKTGTTAPRRAELLGKIHSTREQLEDVGRAITHLRYRRVEAGQAVEDATRSAHTW